jgi:hypothetical protein
MRQSVTLDKIDDLRRAATALSVDPMAALSACARGSIVCHSVDSLLGLAHAEAIRAGHLEPIGRAFLQRSARQHFNELFHIAPVWKCDISVPAGVELDKALTAARLALHAGSPVR